MQSGHIQQFAHLSQFKTVKEFNDSIKNFLQLHGDSFTEGEHIALRTLIQYSVKVHGICNAKICKLLEATHASGQPISRTTFERMLRKGRKLGLLTTYNTNRKKGGKSHNVYVFHRFDVSNTKKLTHQQPAPIPPVPSPQTTKTTPEATLSKTKKRKDKEIRKVTFESLDYTFVPSHVPSPFVKAAKPFFPSAKEICALWDRVMMAHRKMECKKPVETYLPVIIQAFKESVYRYKKGEIKTSFMPYFYGTLSTFIAHEVILQGFMERDLTGNAGPRWLR
ncbi:hypothetical protein [Halalkalibacter okhensis]|uniref:hypothetical protein n=1 Tax=Halalkalibacter okhensis TaxID=333138 RepID=UPI00068CE67D|nr:hypothetical protein [Halalkalibacter okhensis]